MMKLISRNTDYAVRAICYIARQKERMISAEELAKVLEIPRPFLRKILQILNKRAILVSHRGNLGGFMLARSADKILLLDIIEAFQGAFRLNECTFKKEICPNRKSCFLKKKIDSIEEYVFSQLRTVTIGSILRGK
jgi:Rrf2 family protein